MKKLCAVLVLLLLIAAPSSLRAAFDPQDALNGDVVKEQAYSCGKVIIYRFLVATGRQDYVVLANPKDGRAIFAKLNDEGEMVEVALGVLTDHGKTFIVHEFLSRDEVMKRYPEPCGYFTEVEA
jgi:hypothetical protein